MYCYATDREVLNVNLDDPSILLYRWNLYTPTDKIVLLTCVGALALSLISVVFGLGIPVDDATLAAAYRGWILLVWVMALLTASLQCVRYFLEKSHVHFRQYLVSISGVCLCSLAYAASAEWFPLLVFTYLVVEASMSVLILNCPFSVNARRLNLSASWSYPSETRHVGWA